MIYTKNTLALVVIFPKPDVLSPLNDRILF